MLLVNRVKKWNQVSNLLSDVIGKQGKSGSNQVSNLLSDVIGKQDKSGSNQVSNVYGLTGGGKIMIFHLI